MRKIGLVTRLPESILVRIGFVLLVILHFSEQTLAFDNTTSTFVERCRVDCTLKRDLVTCGKFRVVRWLHNVVREKVWRFLGKLFKEKTKGLAFLRGVLL